MKSLCAILFLAFALSAPAQSAAPHSPSSESPTFALGPQTSTLTSDLSPSALPSSTPYVLERATADTVVKVPHKSTGQKIAETLRKQGMSKDLTIAAISTLPIVELRGAIPVGHILLPDTDKSTRLGLDDLRRSARIFLWAVLGNMVPVPFILLLLGPISSLCMKIPIGKRFFDWLFARTRHKTASVEKYQILGLTVFVAVPLPVTGAWTGAMAAFLLGLSFPHAMISIFLGVLIAGVIMTVLALLGWIGAAIAGIVLTGLFVSILAKALKKAA